MQVITWQEKYNTGIDEVDQQHMKLISILNSLQNAMASNLESMVISDVLNSLEKYTRYHFDTEEKLMAASGYAEQSAHIDEHKYFKEKVKELTTEYKKGSHDSGKIIVKFLSDWVLNHILTEDKKLAQSLVARSRTNPR